MKNFNNKKVAAYFDQELQSTLPFTVLPNGALSYKSYTVKQLASGNWALVRTESSELIGQFYLKSCAIMAAKSYNSVQLSKFFDLIELDRQYWANYSDSLVYRHNIKHAKEFNRYLVLLNKLEYSELQAKHFRAKISKMFRWSFV